jgi:hypothetical protein
MKTKTLYIGSLTILLMIVFSFSAFATSNTEYTEKGYLNGNFETGTGIFASGTDGFNPTYTGARSLSVGNTTPLVADLDGDGTNEIIALDNNVIRLYHSSTLNIVAGGLYTETFTYPQFDMLTFDIFGDGKKEIIFGKASGLNIIIDILQWNGASLYLNRSLAFNNSMGLICQSGGCDVEIKCGQANECVAAMTNSYSTETGGRVFYGSFNSTNAQFVNEYHFSAASGIGCFPKVKAASYKDYDGDGIIEYVFSGIDSATTLTNHEFAWIDYIYVNASKYPVGEREITIDLGDIVKTGTSPSCASGLKWVSDSTVILQGVKSMVTNPFVYDITSGTSSGNPMQTVVAYMKERDTIEMKSYNSDSSLLATYPASGYGDGFLISDIFRANAFTEGKTGLANNAVDFCVAGFTAQESASNACGNSYNGRDLTSCASLLCGSQIAQNTKNLIGWHSTEFVLPLDGLYNLSTSPGFQNSITHSGSMDSGGANSELRNVIWAYGVSNFDFSNCEDGLTTKPICYIHTIYNITKQDGIVIPVDVEKSGKNDLLVQQQNTLWYLNDGFTNTPVADFCTTNTSVGTVCTGWQPLSPCTTNGAWQVNTSVLVTITPRDVDVFPTNTVRARAILYYNTVNAIDSNWSNYMLQGTPITFTFTASSLATTATLRMMANDDANPNITKIYDKSFSVAITGVSNGECSEGIDVGSASPASNYSLAPLSPTELKPNTANNPIKNALVQVNDLSGGGMGLATLWLIIMAVVAYAIWTGESHATGTDPRGAMGVIAIVEIIMTVLGIWLGFFGIGIIIIFVILGILILAMFLRKVVTGSGS